MRQALKKKVRKLGLYRVQDIFNPGNNSEFQRWQPHLRELDWLHDQFADEDSKRQMVDVISYRIMGPHHIRLPLCTSQFATDRKRAAALADLGSKLPEKSGVFDLFRHNLHPLGWDIQLFMPLGSPVYTYILEQYANRALELRVNEGDVVLDCGGCWGDTALYFASLAGQGGRVLSFEFMAENLQVFHKNLALNPKTAPSIEIVPYPVWSSSGVNMNFSESGPASRVKPGDGGNAHVSVSIDDEVRKRCFDHVDFIKMDIEGAEFEALKGARETLIRHKPDLALCVYHSREDFTRLARFVHDLDLGYRFALGHFTFHAEETVLYATAR